MSNTDERMPQARVTGGAIYSGNNEYKGLGMARWCALCGTHKSQLGGTIRHIYGGRHWVCKMHKKD